MSKSMEHVRYLVDIIGFRPPTSEGERWASKYIAGVLEKLGVDHQVESFVCHKTLSYPLMIVWSVSVLGGWLACSHGFWGFLLTALGAVAGLDLPAVAQNNPPGDGQAESCPFRFAAGNERFED